MYLAKKMCLVAILLTGKVIGRLKPSARYLHAGSRLMASSVFSPRGNMDFIPSIEYNTGNNGHAMNKLDPLIYHIELDKPHEGLIDAIHSEVSEVIPKDYLKQLIEFGSVYMRKKEDKKPHRVRIGDVDKLGNSLERGTYFRISVNPRRYPEVWRVEDWRSKVLYESEELLVVNKPPGLPCTETADNMKENLRYQMERTIGFDGFSRRLELASRLDLCTEGIVVFAKTSRAISQLNNAFRNSAVTKIYRLRCRSKPSITSGSVVHSWNKPERNRMPGLLSPPGESLKRQAELQILHSLPSNHKPAWLAEVQLKTGLTHQIRLQFSALGAALHGDTRYTPVEGLLASAEEVEFGPVVQSNIDLQCASLTFHNERDLPSGSPLKFEVPPPSWYA